MTLRLTLAGLLAAVTGPALAASLEVSGAWVPPAEATGADVPLYFTVENGGGAADALLRVRCPVAHFTEKRTVDKGEGGTAHREVNSIPVPADASLRLQPEGFHVVLLQTTQPLRAGDTFSCALSFKEAGRREVEVRVGDRPPPP